MCQTFYLVHETCTCIYIYDEFIPCEASSSFFLPRLPKPSSLIGYRDPFADPEDPFADPTPDPDAVFVQAARSKLLTRARAGVDFSNDKVDFVSTDVEDVWAPRGVVCGEGIEARALGRMGGRCALCGKRVGEEVVENGKGGKGKKVDTGMGAGEKVRKEEEASTKKGKEKGISKVGTAAVKSLKNAFGSRAKKPDSSSAGDSAVREEESSAAKDAVGKDKKPKAPSIGMYIDKWGRPIPTYC